MKIPTPIKENKLMTALVVALLTTGGWNLKLTVGGQEIAFQMGEIDKAGIERMVTATRNVTWASCERAYAEGLLPILP